MKKYIVTRNFSNRGNIHEVGDEIALTDERAKEIGSSFFEKAGAVKEVSADSLESKLKPELIAICEEMGLETKGNKGDLIERIEAAQKGDETPEGDEDDEDIDE